jgi:hypothetical protein
MSKACGLDRQFRGISQAAQGFRAKLCYKKRPEAMLQASTTGLTDNDHVRIEMAPTIYSRLGGFPAIGTNGESASINMEARP